MSSLKALINPVTPFEQNAPIIYCENTKKCAFVDPGGDIHKLLHIAKDFDLIPEKIKEIGQRTYRSIKIENEELEFSDGFVDLHTKVYEEILKGNGHTLSDAKSAIEIVHKIRNSEAVGLIGEYHPLAKLPMSKHPFKK